MSRHHPHLYRAMLAARAVCACGQWASRRHATTAGAHYEFATRHLATTPTPAPADPPTVPEGPR